VNVVLFVLVLASSDGGINTDLKFGDMASCRATATSLIAAEKNRSDVIGDRIGFRYVRAICVRATNLITKAGAA